MPPLSVVVPTRDRPDHLDACLRALRHALRPEDEVIVVDSASTEPVAAPDVTVVRVDRPGASLARNAGVAAARHAIVAFVDDDVRVQPGWPGAVAGAFADPSVAFVTGRLLPPPGVVAERPVAVKDGDAPARLDASAPAGTIGHGGNFAVLRSVFDAVGGFDVALGPGARFRAAEDLDLFDRLLGAGFAGRYEPAALAWHEQWRDRWALLALDFSYGVGSGARLAKLARVDRGRARTEADDWVWRCGVRDGVLGALRQRHEFALLTALSRLAGTGVGFAAARAARRG